MMNLATKADLERFATKKDLERFATKEELRTELERFATKEDLALLRAELHRELNLQTWRFIQWNAGAMAALTAIFTAITKLT